MVRCPLCQSNVEPTGQISCPVCGCPVLGANRLPAGTVVAGSRYTIQHWIKGTDEANVYVAVDQSRSMPVLLRESRGSREEQKRRIERARLVTSLGHSAMVQVYDTFDDQESVFVVTEHLQGDSLATYVAQHGPVLPDGLLRLATRTTEAVAALHGAGLVHGHLSPASLFLAEFGRPALFADGTGLAFGRHFLPLPGEDAGSGGPGEPAADLFALAASLWFLATGQLPGDRVRADDLPRALDPVLADSLVTLHTSRGQAMSAEELRRRLSPTAPASRPAMGPLREKKPVAVIIPRPLSPAAGAQVPPARPFGRLLGHEVAVSSVAFNATGQRLVSISKQGALVVWDKATWVRERRVSPPYAPLAPVFRLLHTFRKPQPVMAVHPDPDDDWLFLGSGKTLHQFDLEAGVVKRAPRGGEGDITAVSISLNGACVAIASSDRKVRLLRTGTRTEYWVRSGHQADITGIAFTSGGSRVVSASKDATLRWWNTDGGGDPKAERLEIGPLVGLAAVPAGSMLAAVSETTQVQLIPTEGEPEKPLPGDGYRCVALNESGSLLATGSTDGLVRVWDTVGRKLVHQFTEEGAVTCLAFHRDGRLLAAGLETGAIGVWSLESAAEGKRR